MTPEERTLALRNEPSITCGHCGETAAVDAWCSRPVTGDLPRAHYQCPACGIAFRRCLGIDPARKWRGEQIILKPVQSFL